MVFGLNLRFFSCRSASGLLHFGPLRAAIDGAQWYAFILLIILAFIECLLFAALGIYWWLILTSFPPFSVDMLCPASSSCLAWVALLWHYLGWTWACLELACALFFLPFFSVLLVYAPWSHLQWWLNDLGRTYGVDSKLELSLEQGCHGFWIPFSSVCFVYSVYSAAFYLFYFLFCFNIVAFIWVNSVLELLFKWLYRLWFKFI